MADDAPLFRFVAMGAGNLKRGAPPANEALEARVIGALRERVKGEIGVVPVNAVVLAALEESASNDGRPGSPSPKKSKSGSSKRSRGRGKNGFDALECARRVADEVVGRYGPLSLDQVALALTLVKRDESPVEGCHASNAGGLSDMFCVVSKACMAAHAALLSMDSQNNKPYSVCEAALLTFAALRSLGVAGSSASAWLDPVLRRYVGSGVDSVGTLVAECPRLLAGFVRNDLPASAFFCSPDGVWPPTDVWVGFTARASPGAAEASKLTELTALGMVAQTQENMLLQGALVAWGGPDGHAKDKTYITGLGQLGAHVGGSNAAHRGFALTITGARRLHVGRQSLLVPHGGPATAKTFRGYRLAAVFQKTRRLDADFTRSSRLEVGDGTTGREEVTAVFVSEGAMGQPAEHGAVDVLRHVRFVEGPRGREMQKADSLLFDDESTAAREADFQDARWALVDKSHGARNPSLLVNATARGAERTLLVSEENTQTGAPFVNPSDKETETHVVAFRKAKHWSYSGAKKSFRFGEIAMVPWGCDGGPIAVTVLDDASAPAAANFVEKGAPNQPDLIVAMNAPSDFVGSVMTSVHLAALRNRCAVVGGSIPAVEAPPIMAKTLRKGGFREIGLALDSPGLGGCTTNTGERHFTVWVSARFEERIGTLAAASHFHVPKHDLHYVALVAPC